MRRGFPAYRDCTPARYTIRWWEARSLRTGNATRDRHLPAAFGPDVRLLHRREEPLRGRPGDRGEGAAALAAHAQIAARENRAFLGRAVRYLAAEAGIRQFLDIGTGLPTMNNVHEVAQRVRRRPASSTSTTTRWCSRTRGPCSPPSPRAAPPTSRPTCATRSDPVRARHARGARLRPAGRADARRDPALRPGRVRARRGSSPPCSTRCRRAATWPRRTWSRITTRSRRPPDSA